MVQNSSSYGAADSDPRNLYGCRRGAFLWASTSAIVRSFLRIMGSLFHRDVPKLAEWFTRGGFGTNRKDMNRNTRRGGRTDTWQYYHRLLNRGGIIHGARLPSVNAFVADAYLRGLFASQISSIGENTPLSSMHYEIESNNQGELPPEKNRTNRESG